LQVPITWCEMQDDYTAIWEEYFRKHLWPILRCHPCIHLERMKDFTKKKKETVEHANREQGNYMFTLHMSIA